MPRPLLLADGSVVDVRTGAIAVRSILERFDLVLLDGDPAADVANLHRVDGVVRAGTYHSRADPDSTRRRLAADRRAA